MGSHRRRRTLAWVLAVVATPVLALALIPLRGSQLGLAAALVVLLLEVAIVATSGELAAALAAAVLAFGFADWYYVKPLHTFEIARTDDLVVLLAFVAIAVLVSVLASQLARRARDVARVQLENEILAAPRRTSPLLARDRVSDLLARLQVAFDLDGVTLFSVSQRGWHCDAVAGERPPSSPPDGDLIMELDAGSVLVARGKTLTPDDKRLLLSFAAELRESGESVQREVDRVSQAAAAESHRARTAVLASVSHGLRTPLTSIKAAADSALSPDVHWSADDIREFRQIIDQEAERLDRRIGQMLDLSRIRSGSLDVHSDAVVLADIVDSGLAYAGADRRRVLVDLDNDFERVRTDEALLARSLGEIIANAMTWSRPDERVLVHSERAGTRVRISVVDHGPGIAPEKRQNVFEAFASPDTAKAGDATNTGLGLAIARGFIEAAGGTVRLRETPGGGATLVVEIAAV